MDPFLGEIKIFAGNYAPVNYAFCYGQVLSIDQYGSLYALLGTKYGTDGPSTFRLPDLRGRTPIGAGNGYHCGQQGGFQHVPLGADQVPRHSHSLQGIQSGATTTEPQGRSLADEICYAGVNHLVDMNSHAIAPPGSDAHYNIQPGMGLSFIIAMVGTVPS